MAVYERSYRPFEGELTPKEIRFLVLPRYAYQHVFRSKLFIAFIGVWFLYLLVLAFLIYLPNNLSILEKLGTTSQELTVFPLFNQNASWFFWGFMFPMAWFAFATTLVIGPGLISPDLRNNGLPLYLSRPFSRTEYILGKVSVLVILLSAISWIPGLALFMLKAYFGGWQWIQGNFRIGIAICLSCWIGILMLCLLSMTFSAYLKWRPVAALAMLTVFFAAWAFSNFLGLWLQTVWIRLLDPFAVLGTIWDSLVGTESPGDIPAGAAWLSPLTLCAICVLLLYRKIRAYEIVR
jgi:ABC-2 type transport system permease protein